MRHLLFTSRITPALLLCSVVSCVHLDSTNWIRYHNRVTAAQTAAWQETAVQPDFLAGRAQEQLHLGGWSLVEVVSVCNC